MVYRRKLKMKQNKNRRIAHYTPNSVKGFTLIEFLVASMLAMIVIVAASGTYMITRRLNTNAQERISVQQDIRNASVQMARDARMAGSFGCFNTGKNNVHGKGEFNITAKNADASGIVMLNSTEQDGFGVRVMDSSALGALSGLSNPSDALVFIYGQSATAASVKPTTALIPTSLYDSDSTAKSKISALDKVFFNRAPATGGTAVVDDSDSLKRTLEQKGDVVLSTCSAIARVEGINTFAGSEVGIKDTEIRASDKHLGELSLSKLHASLYVLGDINRAGTQWPNEKALLRYDLGTDGKWQNPQLLATGIQSMSFAFGYVNVDPNTCKKEITSASNSETFSFSNNPNAKQTPALVQIRLKYYGNKASSDPKNTAVVRDYIINTTVRAGNTCANRVITS